MNNITLQKLKPTVPICENIGCGENLGYFDIKNKHRFCRKCRINYYVVRWKCKKCPNIINSSECRETTKLCRKCRGIPDITML